jgi:hypothetical protein
MKILHVCFSRSWGGLEKNSFDLALAQKNAGQDVLYACRKGFALERELKKTGIPCVSFANIVAYIDLRVIFKLRSLVKSEKITIVHGTHTEDLGLIVPALVGLEETRFFFTLQMNVAGPKKDSYHRFEYGRIRRIFVSSPILRDSALRHLPVGEEQMMVIPYGIDTGIYKPERDERFRASLGFGPDTPVLGILARLDPPKGQMEAIQAMPTILKKYPTARLMLVGDESVDHKGAETKRLKNEVERLGLGETVLFVPDKRGAEQAKYLNVMDAFLSPSHYETYSTSMIMAQLCAVPIVGTNAGGTPEQLGYGKYGELVEPKDPASLASGTLKLLDDLSAARKRAEEFGRSAADKFEMKKVVERILSEYRRGD